MMPGSSPRLAMGMFPWSPVPSPLKFGPRVPWTAAVARSASKLPLRPHAPPPDGESTAPSVVMSERATAPAPATTMTTVKTSASAPTPTAISPAPSASSHRRTAPDGKAREEPASNGAQPAASPRDIRLPPIAAAPSVSNVTPCNACLVWAPATLLLGSVTVEDASATYEIQIVREGDDRAAARSLVSSEAHVLVDGLRPRSRYSFRVRVASVLSSGTTTPAPVGIPGEWSPACHIETPAAVPDVPELHVSGRTRQQVTLRWSQCNDNGSPIMEFQLEWDAGQAADPPAFRQLYTGQERMYKCGGKAGEQLQANCRYRFRVRAANAIGAGPWSRVIEANLAAGRPAAPGPPSLEWAGVDWLRIRWLEPESGGAPITAYRVEMKAAGGSDGCVRRASGRVGPGPLTGPRHAVPCRAMRDAPTIPTQLPTGLLR